MAENTSDAPRGVKVRYDGTYAQGDDGTLEFGDIVLPLDEEVTVSRKVADHLTSGENATLYKVTVL